VERAQLSFFAPSRRVVDIAEGLKALFESPDLMYLCGKAIHLSRREPKTFKQVLGTPLGGYRRSVVEVQPHTTFPDG
jgi:hypothetical protein